MSGEARYRERLYVPLRWWVQATMFLATGWIALVVATPPALAWSATAVLCATTFALMGWIGSARVEVGEHDLVAGRGRIPLDQLGPAQALDREETTRAMGVEADARAWLVTRPYLHRSVRVPVTDPHDPTPYWLISTRRPGELAAALTTGAPAVRQPPRTSD